MPRQVRAASPRKTSGEATPVSKLLATPKMPQRTVRKVPWATPQNQNLTSQGGYQVGVRSSSSLSQKRQMASPVGTPVRGMLQRAK